MYKERNGKKYEETSGQDGFLRVMYNNALGRGILRFVSKPVFSKLGGMILSTGFSKLFVPWFIKKHHIDIKEYEKSQFSSFNDFFTRKIKEEYRPFPKEEELLGCPSDGKISVYPITKQQTFYIKNSIYTVKSLLRNKKLAARYYDGYAMVIRLAPDDYHRYCYFDECNQGELHRIEGSFYTVNPHALYHEKVFKENTREYSVLYTKHFGKVIQIEVGALMVGKINNYYDRARKKRGAEKGRFEFGGSTIILLFEKNKVVIDEDLVMNTFIGYETKVKQGEPVARAKRG